MRGQQTQTFWDGCRSTGVHSLPHPESQPPCSTVDMAHRARCPVIIPEVTLSLSCPIPVLSSQTFPPIPQSHRLVPTQLHGHSHCSHTGTTFPKVHVA